MVIWFIINGKKGLFSWNSVFWNGYGGRGLVVMTQACGSLFLSEEKPSKKAGKKKCRKPEIRVQLSATALNFFPSGKTWEKGESWLKPTNSLFASQKAWGKKEKGLKPVNSLFASQKAWGKREGFQPAENSSNKGWEKWN